MGAFTRSFALSLPDRTRRTTGVLATVAVIAAMCALAPAPATAATTISCAHLRVSYSEFFVGVAYPASVSSSTCSADTGVSTSASGGGSFTIDSQPGPSLVCNGGNLEECAHYDLTITVGGQTIHPVFDTFSQVYFDPVAPSALPNSTFDFGTAGPIIKFAVGTGTGALNSICRYDPVNVVENCAATGWFTWVP